MTKPRVAINGFGRIGRLLLRHSFDQFDYVAINDLSDVNNLAYLLKYDTVYRTYDKPVRVVSEEGKNYLQIGNPSTGSGQAPSTGSGLKNVLVLQEKEPAALPWKDLGIDVAVEATGVFESFEKASVHLTAGAKRTVITAPAKDEERADAKTVLLGLNEENFKTCKITSNGSCTTNATHPLAAIMHESVGIKKAMLNSVHGYTATQSLVDGTAGRSKDFRRGRAAAMNIVPSTSGATVSVTRVLTDLSGKFDGVAMRVPVITVSLADLTFLAGRPTTAEEINNIFRQAVQTPRWRETVAVVEDPIVSSDVIGLPYGVVADLSLTRVVDGDLVKVFGWYDNEMGYVATLVKHIERVTAVL